MAATQEAGDGSEGLENGYAGLCGEDAVANGDERRAVIEY